MYPSVNFFVIHFQTIEYDLNDTIRTGENQVVLKLYSFTSADMDFDGHKCHKKSTPF